MLCLTIIAALERDQEGKPLVVLFVDSFDLVVFSKFPPTGMSIQKGAVQVEATLSLICGLTAFAKVSY